MNMLSRFMRCRLVDTLSENKSVEIVFQELYNIWQPFATKKYTIELKSKGRKYDKEIGKRNNFINDLNNTFAMESKKR